MISVAASGVCRHADCKTSPGVAALYGFHLGMRIQIGLGLPGIVLLLHCAQVGASHQLQAVWPSLLRVTAAFLPHWVLTELQSLLVFQAWQNFQGKAPETEALLMS